MDLQFVDAESSISNSRMSSVSATAMSPSPNTATQDTSLDAYGKTILQGAIAFVLSPNTTWKHIAGAAAGFIIITALISYLVSALMPLLVVIAIAVLAYFFFKM